MRFQDILDKYSIPYHIGDRFSRPGWINLVCPQCHKAPYLGYNIAYKSLNCWSCGRLSLRSIISQLTHITDGKELQELIGSIPGNDRRQRDVHVGTLELPDNILPAWTQLHWDYLLDRGKIAGEPERFDPNKLMTLWDVACIGHVGRHRWRLYIPVILNGQVVSWTTRAIGTIEPRYSAAKREQSAIPIEDCLYGIDYCRNSVLIHEGPIDVWASGPGSVATMGLRVSPAQMRVLALFPQRVVCFDNEREAQKRARKLARDLSILPGTTHSVVLQSAKDAASASAEELRELRRRYLE